MLHSPDDVYILSTVGRSIWVRITEKNCYMSEWTEEEQEKGFHKASLNFANNSKGERVKRVGSVSTPCSGTLESYGQVFELSRDAKLKNLFAKNGVHTVEGPFPSNCSTVASWILKDEKTTSIYLGAHPTLHAPQM